MINIRNLFRSKKSNKSTVLDIREIVKSFSSEFVHIDCGANVGVITRVLAENGAKVIAFEPNPYAFEVLQSSMKDLSNITFINKAIWDRDTELNLYLHESSDKDPVFWSQGSSLIDSKTNVDRDKYIKVPVIDITKFIESIEHPIGILKIDIEGAEYEIIEKLLKTELYKRIGKIYIETHAHKIPGLKEKDSNVRAMLKAMSVKNISLDWI